ELDERLQTRILDATLTTVAVLDDWEASSLERLGGLSLQRLSQMTFATFDPRGMAIEEHQRDNLRRVFQRARMFAEQPEGWFVLQGAPGPARPIWLPPSPTSVARMATPPTSSPRPICSITCARPTDRRARSATTRCSTPSGRRRCWCSTTSA